MSYNLVDSTTGALTRVAGRGKAEYGASSVRSGTYIPSGPVQAQEDLSFSVTFSEPMPDNDYQVIFGSSSYGDASGTIQCVVRDRSTTGFTGIIRNVGPNEVSVASGTFTWFAFKLYSDVEYSNIVNSMPSDASASNKLVTESDANDLRIQTISTGTYNDITTAGHYFVTISDSDTNKPVAGYNFFLHVYEGQNGMYVRQIAYMAGHDHNEMYSRAKYNGSWGEWRKLVTDSDFNYKSGTVNFTCGANLWNTVDVNFDSPMPDADYVVTLESGNTGYVHVQNVTIKSTNGFTIIVWNRDELTADRLGIINWQAYKIPH